MKYFNNKFIIIIAIINIKFILAIFNIEMLFCFTSFHHFGSALHPFIILTDIPNQKPYCRYQLLFTLAAKVIASSAWKLAFSSASQLFSSPALEISANSP